MPSGAMLQWAAAVAWVYSVHTCMPSGAMLQWAAAVAWLYSVHTCMPSGAPSTMHRDDRNAVYGTALPYEATWLTDQHNRPPVARN